MTPRMVQIHPHTTVAAKGLPKRGDIVPIVLLKGVALSLARVHNIRPDVIYVPMHVQIVGRKMTIKSPRDPPSDPVACR